MLLNLINNNLNKIIKSKKMLEKTNTFTRRQRLNTEKSEYNDIFDSITSNNIQKLTQYI